VERDIFTAEVTEFYADSNQGEAKREKKNIITTEVTEVTEIFKSAADGADLGFIFTPSHEAKREQKNTLATEFTEDGFA